MGLGVDEAAPAPRARCGCARHAPAVRCPGPHARPRPRRPARGGGGGPSRRRGSWRSPAAEPSRRGTCPAGEADVGSGGAAPEPPRRAPREVSAPSERRGDSERSDLVGLAPRPRQWVDDVSRAVSGRHRRSAADRREVGDQADRRPNASRGDPRTEQRRNYAHTQTTSLDGPFGPGLVAGAVWASVSLAAGRLEQGSLGREPRAVTCQPTDPQPAAPLEMNTVQVDDLAKTVAMEKELFSCQDPAVGSNFSRDVETFVEMIEKASATNVTTISRRVRIATCDKNFAPTGAVTCRSHEHRARRPHPQSVAGLSAARAGRGGADAARSGGDEQRGAARLHQDDQGRKGGAQLPGAIGDVYLFTEMLEKKTAAAQGYAPFATRFDGIICRKDPQQGAITGCSRFRPSESAEARLPGGPPTGGRAPGSKRLHGTPNERSYVVQIGRCVAAGLRQSCPLTHVVRAA